RPEQDEERDRQRRVPVVDENEHVPRQVVVEYARDDDAEDDGQERDHLANQPGGERSRHEAEEHENDNEVQPVHRLAPSPGRKRLSPPRPHRMLRGAVSSRRRAGSALSMTWGGRHSAPVGERQIPRAPRPFLLPPAPRNDRAGRRAPDSSGSPPGYLSRTFAQT